MGNILRKVICGNDVPSHWGKSANKSSVKFVSPNCLLNWSNALFAFCATIPCAINNVFECCNEMSYILSLNNIYSI